MTKLCPQPLLPLKQMPITDDSAPNACTDRQIKQMIVSLPCTISPFSQRSKIGIIAEINGASKMGRDLLSEREILPFLNVWRFDNDSRTRVKWTRRSDSYCVRGSFSGITCSIK